MRLCNAISIGALCAMALLGGCRSVSGTDEAYGLASRPVPDAWSVEVRPYAWRATGSAGLLLGAGGQKNVSVGLSDLFGDFEMAGLLPVEIRRGDARWAILIENAYGRYGDEGIASLDFEIDGGFTELDLAYQPLEEWPVEVLAGGRLWITRAELTIPGLGSLSDTVEWVDPIIGLRSKVHLSGLWNLRLRGDVAIPGVGSESAQQVVGTLEYGGPRMGVALGYRSMSYEFTESGYGLAVDLSGPVFGLYLNL